MCVPFYVESEKLVRFLNAADKTKFQVMLDALARGSLFENALHGAHTACNIPSLHQLEEVVQALRESSQRWRQ